MAKKVLAVVKLQVPAGKANPSPPIGPALGQHGADIMGFCKEFNERTSKEEQGLILPVVIQVFADRSFTFIITTPPTAVLLKRAANIKKASGEPHIKKVATLTMQQIESIAKIKQPDTTAGSLQAVMNSVMGTARSMGINVIQ